MKKWIAMPVIAVLAIGIIVTAYLLVQQTGKLGEARTDLKTANAEVSKLREDVKAQQNINSTLTTELKKVKDPRHFSSLAELVDWLYKDDTDTKYANATPPKQAFILQVRALRDGYLLPAFVYSTIDDADNTAVIGDSVYSVNPANDTSYRYATTRPIPSHPLPLD